IYDPDRNDLTGWLRQNDRLELIETMEDWISPRLAIRFGWSNTELKTELKLFRPDGSPFASYTEVSKQLEIALQIAEQERQRAEQEHQRAEQEHQRAEQERQTAEQERQRADRLAEQLRSLGIDPS
ncbi:MAG: Uma2 family endonuclease, partial [Prochlorotrichaceae cyanobacterium]